MTPELLNQIAVTPAFLLLPASMHAQQARVMLVTICLQESNLKHRRQIAYYRDGRPVHGPARGWPQFESAGVRGVMTHRATKGPARTVATALGHPFELKALHLAIEHDDVLALAYARLNLWWLPRALPAREDVDEALAQYVATWRPGAWTRGTLAKRAELRTRWGRNYARALDVT